MNRFKQTELGRQSIVLKDPSGFEKVSECITALAKPWLDETTSYAESRELLLFAMTAWNMSLLPDEEHDAQYNELAKKGVTGEQETILREMVRRKKQLFPDNQRVILDYEFKPVGNILHLNVVSTIPAPP